MTISAIPGPNSTSHQAIPISRTVSCGNLPSRINLLSPSSERTTPLPPFHPGSPSASRIFSPVQFSAKRLSPSSRNSSTSPVAFNFPSPSPHMAIEARPSTPYSQTHKSLRKEYRDMIHQLLHTNLTSDVYYTSPSVIQNENHRKIVSNFITFAMEYQGSDPTELFNKINELQDMDLIDAEFAGSLFFILSKKSINRHSPIPESPKMQVNNNPYLKGLEKELGAQS